MAVKFSASFGTLATTAVSFNFGNGSALGATVYTGTIPTINTILNNWTNYNQSASSTLWHGSTGLILQILGTNIINGSSFPTVTAPLRNGTATWFIVWALTNVNINTTTIPTTRFMIGDVSNIFGDGMMKFESVTFSTATPITISEFNFRINYVG